MHKFLFNVLIKIFLFLQIDKCEQYWPNANTTTVYGGVTVTCTREDVNAEFTQRTFTVEMVFKGIVFRHVKKMIEQLKM